MALELTGEQKMAVEDRGGALLVSAAAGSGKTRVLVERLMDHVVREGRNIDEFLVITFTNAAAAELRGRVAQALTRRLAEKPHDGHLRRQTALVYQARICTIDSFCMDFLRECGHLAGVDPDFRLCDEVEGKALLAAALDGVLEERYDNMEQDSGFVELAEALAGDRDDQTLAEVVLDIHRRVQSHPDPMGWLRERRQDFDLGLETRPEDTPWGRLLLEDASDQAAYWAKALEGALERAAFDPVVYANYAPGLELTISDLLAFSAACRSGWDKAASCVVRFPRAGSKRGGEPALKEGIKDVRARCKKQIEGLEERFSVTAGEAMEDLRALRPAMVALLTVVEETAQSFQKEKARRRLLDFSDAEHLAAALLAGPDGSPTPLALEWQDRFAEIMVDEYQDTNEVQNVLFNALSRRGENLFLVGDVKQSIYRFRLAEPGIFLEKYHAYAPQGKAGVGEPRKAVLSRNFRSRPEVLDGVNFLFRNIMSRELGELDYDDSQALRSGRDGLLYDPGCAMELNVVNLADVSDGDDEEGKTPKPLIQARAVAHRVGQLLEGGLLLTDGEGKRPARPEDVVILLRSPGPVLRYYTQALDESGIPWSAEAGEDFFDITEIHVALSFLRIIDNPRQDVPLLAVLRSPLFAFTPDRLAFLRAGAREGDIYCTLSAAAERGEEDCARFLALLQELRGLAGEMSSHQLIWELYGRVNLPAVFGAMEGGVRRRANLMALYDAARCFERGGHKGLYGFLTHIARMAESGKPLLAAREEQGGVRIMSIHRSKGLEFPVVFLCGLDRQFNDADLRATILFHSKLGLGPKRTDRARMLRYTTLPREAVALALKKESRAEELRLLYVAMTRAEQKLILFTTVNGRMDQLSPLAGQAECPVHPQALGTCRSPVGWVLMPVLCRPDAGALRGLTEEPPTLCAAEGYPWDIRVMNGSDYEKPLSNAQTEVEEGTVPAQPDPDLVKLLSWTYPHAASVNMPSKLTATQLKGRLRDEEVAQETDVPRPPAAPLSRPHFTQGELSLTPAQRGTALHQAMQFIDYAKAATEEGVTEELERLERYRFLTPAQKEVVEPGLISGFFQSNLGRRLLAASRVEREFKFSLLVPASDCYTNGEPGEEVLLQGVVDCWFEDGEGVTVVDFKTDAVTEDTVEARCAGYAPQMEAYSAALSRVLGRKVDRRVLWFFRLGRGIEV